MTPSPPIAPDSLFGKTSVRAVISSATEQSKEGEIAECPPEHIDYIKANDMEKDRRSNRRTRAQYSKEMSAR